MGAISGFDASQLRRAPVQQTDSGERPPSNSVADELTKFDRSNLRKASITTPSPAAQTKAPAAGLASVFEAQIGQRRQFITGGDEDDEDEDQEWEM